MAITIAILHRMVEAPTPTGVSETEGDVPLSRGERIATLRESLGLSQQDFAAEAGFSQGYLCQIENDDVRNIGYNTATAIVRVGGLGYEFLEGRPDSKVFLRPEARQLFQILTSPEINLARRKAIEMAITEFIPDPGTESNFRYIDIAPREKTLGDVILEARGYKTQKQVAEDASLSQGYLSQLEGGDVKSPSLSVLRRLAQVLNIEIDELLGIKEVAYPTFIELFDRFLRSSIFTDKQKASMLNAFTSFVSFVLNAPQDDLERFNRILSSLINSIRSEPQSANQDSNLS